MEYNASDLAQDSLYIVLVAIIIGLFFLPSKNAPCASVSTPVVTKVDTIVTKPNKVGHPNHVSLKMLEEVAPYPKLAYATVVLESGGPNNKSYLAEMANNNLGMRVSRKRFNCATLKDTSAIKAKLDLYYGADYRIVKYGNKVVTNVKGDTLVGINGTWAIFLTPEDCANDIAEYQNLYIKPEHTVSPHTYVNRLKELKYFGPGDIKAGYIDIWLTIYKNIQDEANDKVNTASAYTTVSANTNNTL